MFINNQIVVDTSRNIDSFEYICLIYDYVETTIGGDKPGLSGNKRMDIYDGCQDKDSDGKDCLTWTKALIDIKNKPDDFTKWNVPIGLLDNNFCRNPEKKEEGL